VCGFYFDYGSLAEAQFNDEMKVCECEGMSFDVMKGEKIIGIRSRPFSSEWDAWRADF